jgi:flagellar biosynthesis protein
VEEKKKKAIALAYDPNTDAAPKIIASGQGITAEAICRIAQEHKIPLYKNESVAERLIHQELNTVIPPELYTAIAEILAFIYRLDKSKSMK